MNKPATMGVMAVLAIGLVTSYAKNRSLSKQVETLTEDASSEKPAAAPAPAKEKGPEVTLDPAELARAIDENHVLEARIKELEAKLAAAPKPSEAEGESAEGKEADKPKEERPRRDWASRRSDYMAELKEKDPERYQELQERRTKMREHVTDTMERQSAFILNLDESKMSEEQLKNHKALTAMMERNWELMEIAGNDEDPEAQGKARGELMRNVWQMGGLLEKEREVALESMGRDIGYTDQESAEFSAAVQDVYKMTSLRSYMPEGMGRGWGRRGGHGGDKAKSSDK